MRVAAIDCGTNSIRLLIADVSGENFREITRDMEIVRLGQGVGFPLGFFPRGTASARFLRYHLDIPEGLFVLVQRSFGMH